MVNIKRSSFSAVLLAEPSAPRSGPSYALMSVRGRPVWRRQAELLQAVGATELFLATQDAVGYIGGPFRVLTNTHPDRGLLEDIRWALAASRNTIVLVLTAELVGMEAELLLRLLGRSSSACGCIPMYPDGRLEPLSAVYPTRALSLAGDQIAEQDLSVEHFAEKCVAAGVARPLALTPLELGCFAQPSNQMSRRRWGYGAHLEAMSARTPESARARA